MRKISKILSVFLALLMVVTIIPISSITASAEDLETSGTCGENVTWEFDPSTGTLTISGTGDMNDYDFPWRSYKENLKNVIIGDGVTTIGGYAFDHCDNLENVKIGANVKTINWGAFQYCYKLKDVTFPDSLIAIESWAFAECDSITSVTIPDSVITIGDDAFTGCAKLENIIIGSGLKFLFTSTVSTFDCNNLKNIEVSKDNKFFSSENGVLFNKDKTTLIKFPAGIYGEQYRIPDTVTTFESGAFCDVNVNQIVIPDGVTEIPRFTFMGANLTSTVIPNSVTSIGGEVFCGLDNFTDVYYNGTEDEWNSIEIGGGNDSLYSANIHFNNPSGTCGENLTWEYDPSTGTLTISGTGAMDDYESSNNCPCNCPWESYEYNIKKVVINNGVTTVGNYAFDDLFGLKTVIILDSVTTIGDYAFSRCPNITSITIPDSVTTIGNYAFTTCANLKSVTIGNGVTAINSGAFAFCRALLNITIPDSVTTIGERAFYKCSNLTSITIPDSVTTIGPYAFEGCSSLSDVYYTGTEKQWKEIYFDLANEDLLNATIHYNHTPTFTGIKDDYFYKDDVKQKAYQLVEFNGDFYFINDYNKIAKNKRIYLSERFVKGFTFEDGTPLHVGYYDFDEEGKMIIINGVVGDYFYKNGVVQKAYQLVKFNNSFYFINDSHKVAKNKRIYLSQNFVEGFTYADGTPLKVGYYEFDENGKMVILDGPVGDYFYKNNVRLNAYQLVKYKDDYYFINDSHKLAKNKRIYLSQRFVEGTTLAVGYYEFGADGKMVALNGPVGDYFYKDGAMLKAYQLVEFEGDYYFINDSNKLAKNKRIYLGSRFLEGTDLSSGYYNFDAEGKMIIE